MHGIAWAALREDIKIKPAPDFFVDIRRSRGDGGPRKPGERIRFERWHRLFSKLSMRPSIRLIRVHIVIWAVGRHKINRLKRMGKAVPTKAC